MSLPFLKFFPGDWLKDPALSMCSPATRGIWIDLICALHNGEDVSVSGTASQLSRLARCSYEEMESAIAELKSSKTADVNSDAGIHTIVCRRMVREVELSATRSHSAKQRYCKPDANVLQASCKSTANDLQNPHSPLISDICNMKSDVCNLKSEGGTGENHVLAKALLDGEPVKGTKSRETETEKCRRMTLETLREENAPKTPPDAQSPATGQAAHNAATPSNGTNVTDEAAKNMFDGIWKKLSGSDYVAPAPAPRDTRTPMERICDWFRRRHSTQWSDKELRAFKECVLVTHPEDFAVLDAFYTASIPKDKDFRRHEIQTLLNNWNGEIDKAKQWKEGRFYPGPQTPVGRHIDPEHELVQRDKEPLSLLTFTKTDPEHEQNQRNERTKRDKENVRHLAARGMD